MQTSEQAARRRGNAPGSPQHRNYAMHWPAYDDHGAISPLAKRATPVRRTVGGKVYTSRPGHALARRGMHAWLADDGQLMITSAVPSGVSELTREEVAQHLLPSDVNPQLRVDQANVQPTLGKLINAGVDAPTYAVVARMVRELMIRRKLVRIPYAAVSTDRTECMRAGRLLSAFYHNADVDDDAELSDDEQALLKRAMRTSMYMLPPPLEQVSATVNIRRLANSLAMPLDVVEDTISAAVDADLLRIEDDGGADEVLRLGGKLL